MSRTFQSGDGAGVWRARIADMPSPWAAFSSFHVAASPLQWSASSWIGANQTMLRRDFTYTPAANADGLVINAAAAGMFQLYVDGERVDTDVLSTAWTTWNVRVMYFTYRLPKLSAGPHTIGVMLGAGWRDTAEVSVYAQRRVAVCSSCAACRLCVTVVLVVPRDFSSLSSKTRVRAT
jgi:hypothetical protein